MKNFEILSNLQNGFVFKQRFQMLNRFAHRSLTSDEIIPAEKIA